MVVVILEILGEGELIILMVLRILLLLKLNVRIFIDCYNHMNYNYQGRHPPTQLASMVGTQICNAIQTHPISHPRGLLTSVATLMLPQMLITSLLLLNMVMMNKLWLVMGNLSQ